MAGKNWIGGAIKNPGALHRGLGIKKGEKIPVKKLTAAVKKGGKLGQRAQLAITLRDMHRGPKHV
jgi:hypothetical protein